MKIININELKSPKEIGNNFVEITLDKNNISKILLQILYYKEYGIKKFILTYNYNTINIPMSKAIFKIKINKLYKIINKYDIKIGFKGFPRCIFEKGILRPGLRWYFEGKMFFINDTKFNQKEYTKINTCINCMYEKKCQGIYNQYLENFNQSEFSALNSNLQLYELYQDEINNFKSNSLKKIANEVLKDFKKEKYYMRKKFVFVKSYPNNLEDSSKQRFVYYILNRRDDFENTYNFITNYFHNNNIFNDLKPYLKTSNQLVLSCGIMGDNKLRKTFYFTINDLDSKTLKKLQENYLNANNQLNPENIWGIGLDFKNDKICSKKLYYDYKKLSPTQIKDFISDIPLENKKLTLKFLNSLTKSLNHVLLDIKCKNDKLYSKRIDISLQYNQFRLNQFAILFGINTSEFSNKELLTISFELKQETKEKINFYYALKLNDPITQEEESKENNYYNKYN
ncbi:MAG: hypothetical protein ACOC16_01575 [Nanoarchaeota archaeon]